jgi:hypothetical protein
VKVRNHKPSKQRQTVHIQDVLVLINKLSTNEAAAEEAAKMFGRWKAEAQKKIGKAINLD